MKNLILQNSAVLLALVMFAAATSYADEAALAANHADVLAPVVSDDTFLAGYVNVASLDAASWSNVFNFLPLEPAASQARAVTVRALANAIQSLQAAGVEGAYVVWGLGDCFLNHGPLVVVVGKPGADLQQVENGLQGFSQLLTASVRQVPKLSVERRGPQAIAIAPTATMARYETLQASPRDDLAESLAKLADGGAELAVVFSPGPDFRRVVRELWPQLPPPMTRLRGELADRWLRLELAAKMQGKFSAELAVEHRDAESAQLFVELLSALPAASEQLTELGDKRHELKQVLETIVTAVSPRADGTRAIMSFPSDDAQLARLRVLFGQATDEALEASRRQQRVRQFKQMAIAIHVYADAQKHLPPPAIRDKEGKPLLSWRVAILPYVEESGLYKQFHLDEPWDSPHNLALAQSMPAVYSDPALPELASEAKTTYVVPVGPGTMFDTDVGITFREITDGTSKTIMIVEVPPERAVVWTKPDDWQVDMANPLRGIERTDRAKIVTGFCDGSVRTMPTDIKPDVLRAFLTRAGKEVVDWP